MPFSIKMPVVFSTRSPHVATLRNHDIPAAASNSLDKWLGVVTFVGNQIIKYQIFNQIVSLPMVALLTARQNETHGVSKSINRQMDFRGKAAH